MGYEQGGKSNLLRRENKDEKINIGPVGVWFSDE